jgi:uncharacterized protein (DUF2164 family)
MDLEQAKDIFRKDLDAYGKPKALMSKVEQLWKAVYNQAIEDARNEIYSTIDESRDNVDKLRIDG